MRKDVRSQTEKAFVAYLQGSQAETVLSTCQMLAGGLVDVPSTITPPYIIFTAESPDQLGFDSGIYELKLTACLATQVDDEMDAAGQDIHRERVEALRDLLEDVAAIQSAVNPPSGTDTRAVQSFTLSAIVFENDETKAQERKIVSDITYYVCASPSD